MPVERTTMDTILMCGINAPNGMNRQSWEIRVVGKEYIDGVTKLYVEENPDAAKDPSFKNIFRNAPVAVLVAADTEYELSQIDCGLLGENMMLSAWSMGIGSCCLGSPVRFLKSETAKEFYDKLQFSDGYELVYAIGFGYPDEAPAAKPRDAQKIKYVD